MDPMKQTEEYSGSEPVRQQEGLCTQRYQSVKTLIDKLSRKRDMAKKDIADTLKRSILAEGTFQGILKAMSSLGSHVRRGLLPCSASHYSIAKQDASSLTVPKKGIGMKKRPKASRTKKKSRERGQQNAQKK